MRLLLDESIPVKLRRSLPNHDVRTVVEMGWSGVKNGKLLALAADSFDAFVTVPAIRMQQLPTTAPLVGQQVATGRLSSGRHFWLATYVETASAKDVWLTLPKFRVNGIPSSLPRLHFHRQPVVAITVFNC